MISEPCPICDQSDWYQPEEKSRWVCKKCSPPKKEKNESQFLKCDCGSEIFWRAKNSDQWRCEKCSPPVSQVIIAERGNRSATAPGQDEPVEGDSSPTIVSQFTVTECRPMCQRCLGWQATERTWSDGRVECRCRTCGSIIPDGQQLVEVAATGKFRQFECRRRDGSVFARFNRPLRGTQNA
jgi:hypothetical protein